MESSASEPGSATALEQTYRQVQAVRSQMAKEEAEAKRIRRLGVAAASDARKSVKGGNATKIVDHMERVYVDLWIDNYTTGKALDDLKERLVAERVDHRKDVLKLEQMQKLCRALQEQRSHAEEVHKAKLDEMQARLDVEVRKSALAQTELEARLAEQGEELRQVREHMSRVLAAADAQKEYIEAKEASMVMEKKFAQNQVDLANAEMHSTQQQLAVLQAKYADMDRHTKEFESHVAQFTKHMGEKSAQVEALRARAEAAESLAMEHERDKLKAQIECARTSTRAETVNQTYTAFRDKYESLLKQKKQLQSLCRALQAQRTDAEHRAAVYREALETAGLPLPSLEEDGEGEAGEGEAGESEGGDSK